MALTDLQIQDLQKKLEKWKLKEIGAQDSVGNQEYEIVNTQDGTTEAIAVAPVVNGTTDYSQTAIVVAGI
ncbi:hypothetical protein [Streptococcus pantholopis]|uniref:Uncharacterized protein n=1 Tax=Streptococcus pantholopis TaxID=1811193 RepID=A0A172Q6B5_9STRE|nr:hypothetical protein [Streptococcus pantholopis]AND78947.1 hypothetical protein A0O21_02390 [Streptococcus pantholopis]